MKVFGFLMMVITMSFGSINVNAQTSVKEVRNVDVAEASVLATNPEVVVLDVRTAREFASGKIDGAVNIPLNTVTNKAEGLDKSKKYLVYCRSGVRSRRAAMILARKGFEVYNLKGGILAWNRR